MSIIVPSVVSGIQIGTPENKRKRVGVTRIRETKKLVLDVSVKAMLSFKQGVDRGAVRATVGYDTFMGGIEI